MVIEFEAKTKFIRTVVGLPLARAETWRRRQRMSRELMLIIQRRVIALRGGTGSDLVR